MTSMPLGIFAWFGIPTPFPERIKMIRDAGFAATCVWWEQDNPAGRQLRHHAPELVRNAGLVLENIHVPFRGSAALWSTDDELRRATVRQHVAWVEDCARHSIPTLVMHVTASAQTASVPAGIDSLRRILEAAEKHGVVLAIENARRPARIETLLGAIDSPHLGLCYDSGHDWTWGDPPLTLLQRRGRRLVAVHISDTDGRFDRHWLPGEGIVDFDALGETHDWESFAGAFMLEVVPKNPEERPDAFLARAFEAAQKTRRRMLARTETGAGLPQADTCA